MKSGCREIKFRDIKQKKWRKALLDRDTNFCNMKIKIATRFTYVGCENKRKKIQQKNNRNIETKI